VSRLLGENHTNGQLWVCELDVPLEPIWSTQATTPFIVCPPTEHAQPGWSDAFYVSAAFAADVFPPEGNELVVVHKNFCCTPSAVRVYDFGGNVLFEAWHYGPIQDAYWNDGLGLLVCSADRHGTSLDYVGQSGSTRYPRVVFAVAPAVNTRLGWTREKRDRDSGNLEWYKVLWPREYWDPLEIKLRLPRSKRHNAVVGIDLSAGRAHLIGALDYQGRLTADRFMIEDGYGANLAKLPDPSTIQFYDWPPPADNEQH
jgi:hypothetical protein